MYNTKDIISDWVYQEIEDIIIKDEIINNNEIINNDEIINIEEQDIIHEVFYSEQMIKVEILYSEMAIPLLKKNFKGYSSDGKYKFAIFDAEWSKLLYDNNEIIIGIKELKQTLWLNLIGCPIKIKTSQQFVKFVCFLVYSVKNKCISECYEIFINEGFSDILATRICDLLYDNLYIYTFEQSLYQICEPL